MIEDGRDYQNCHLCYMYRLNFAHKIIKKWLTSAACFCLVHPKAFVYRLIFPKHRLPHVCEAFVKRLPSVCFQQTRFFFRRVFASSSHIEIVDSFSNKSRSLTVINFLHMMLPSLLLSSISNRSSPSINTLTCYGRRWRRCSLWW